MLGDILKIINQEGYLSRAMLAQRLNVSPEIIDEGLNQLLRMGYLIDENTGNNCFIPCTNCPFAKSCQKEIVKTFTISEKGKNYLLQV